MSPFISAYREGYSTEHVLVRLIEEWRKKLDDDYIVSGVLMDLSKAFDCIPHDLFAKFTKIYKFIFRQQKTMCAY